MGSVEGRGHFACRAPSCCCRGSSSEGLRVQRTKGGVFAELVVPPQLFWLYFFFILFLSGNRKPSFSSPGRSFTGINQCKFTLPSDADYRSFEPPCILQPLLLLPERWKCRDRGDVPAGAFAAKVWDFYWFVSCSSATLEGRETWRTSGPQLHQSPSHLGSCPPEHCSGHYCSFVLPADKTRVLFSCSLLLCPSKPPCQPLPPPWGHEPCFSPGPAPLARVEAACGTGAGAGWKEPEKSNRWPGQWVREGEKMQIGDRNHPCTFS